MSASADTMSADTDLSVDWNAPPPDDGPNYLQAVTDMAERCQVVAHSAIYNANGIKLVEQGARIDARLYDRLVQHRLQGSIDGHLSAENAVDIAAIQALARQRCQEPLLQRMAQAVHRRTRHRDHGDLAALFVVRLAHARLLPEETRFPQAMQPIACPASCLYAHAHFSFAGRGDGPYASRSIGPRGRMAEQGRDDDASSATGVACGCGMCRDVAGSVRAGRRARAYAR